MTTLLALLLLPTLDMPAPAAPEPVRGWGSAYDPGVFEATVRYRLEHDLWRVPLAADWYTVAGYVALNDCARVGEVTTLVTPADGRAYRVLVADCAGADGGAAWMTANSIVAELDAALWQRLTEMHGRPLRVEVLP